MGDIVDRALQDIETLEKLIPKADITPVATATGECLWCGKRLRKKGARWCDRDCADAWEKAHNKLKRGY